jgi:acyl-CoA reductase-like NAD-dependent aldehyde dehydrogenase
VNGVWIDNRARSGRGAEATLIEPYSGVEYMRFVQGSAQDLDDAVDAAGRAFGASNWQHEPPLQRARVLTRCAQLLRDGAESLAKAEAQNVGRPLRETRHNVGLAADAFEYFASLTTSVRGATVPLGPDLFDYTVKEPLGVCGLITPWNNPLVLASWKIAAGLAAGNALVVKPASLTPVTVMRLAELLAEAGLPAGQLNVVTGPGGELGDRLVRHPGVAKLSFTGSTTVGKRIAAEAGRRLARVSLELGGKSPALVFADADLDLALAGSIPAMFGNAGQMCTARSRLLVHERVSDEFTHRLAERVGAMRIASPFDADAELGPVISRAQLDTVRGFIIRAQEAGAVTMTGGAEPPEEPELRAGFFVRPTVLANVNQAMEAMREEIFGPVLVVDTFSDERDAVMRANDSPYGLAATVWTSDLARAHRVASALEAGTVTINTTKVSHVYAPFGGYKQSGLGRELGREGLDEFLQVKNVIVAVPPA